MFILAIETTGRIGSVAVRDRETGHAATRVTEEPMSHLKNLIPMTEALLRENGVDKKQLGCVAASCGPGSYTGIRIGVATARALGQALDIPCVPVPTLEEFRLKCDGRPAAVILNARRGQVYGAVFGPSGEDILKPGPYMLEDVTKCVREAGIDPVFYGDGIDAYAQSEKYGALLRGCTFAPEEERYQTALLAAEYAEQLFDKGNAVSYEMLFPDYMRETEAEQKLKDGTLAKARAAKMAKFRAR